MKDFNEVVRVAQQHPVLSFASSRGGSIAKRTARTATKASVASHTDLVERYESELESALRDKAGFAAVFSNGPTTFARLRWRPGQE